MQTYSHREEQLNIYSHAAGFVAAVVATFFLVRSGLQSGSALRLWAFVIFGLSMMIQYAASTLYHRATDPVKRSRLRIFDHSAIYVLIAGTYTPFALVGMHNTAGWILFGVSWGIAAIGIVLKFFFTGRLKILSTVLYVGMGWMVVFAVKPLYNALPGAALAWLLAGGCFYTLGAVLYSLKRVKYTHAIFHFFVLAGTFCHFCGIYWWL